MGFQRHGWVGWVVFKKLGTYVAGTIIIAVNFFFVLENNLPSEASANSYLQVGRPNMYHVDRVPETCCM